MLQQYQSQVAQRGTQEWLIRHSLVDQEDLAKTRVQRIQQGEEFALLATEHTMNPNSQPQAGLVGCVSHPQWVPEITAILGQMQASQLWATPVRIARGWHVLHLQAIRPLAPLDPEKIRPLLLELQAQKSFSRCGPACNKKQPYGDVRDFCIIRV